MRVRDVVDFLSGLSAGPVGPDTCDTLKAGSLDREVHGIAVTFMATVEVIEKAAALGADLIVTHEPTFYEHSDEPAWLSGSEVARRKKELIERHGISIWRDHDHAHATKPDALFRGLLTELGWWDRVVPAGDGPDLSPIVVDLAGAPLADVVAHVKEVLGMHVVRVVGNPATCCGRVGIAFGGGSIDFPSRLAPWMEANRIDLLVCGDIVEWTVVPYVRDAGRLGLNRALLVVGHGRSEEPGMTDLVRELKARFGDAVPVTLVEAGEPFLYF
jgi:putative NIF3 family GTP cyclohydrolase 1 type 2